jgi:hypothetical protein
VRLSNSFLENDESPVSGDIKTDPNRPTQQEDSLSPSSPLTLALLAGPQALRGSAPALSSGPLGPRPHASPESLCPSRRCIRRLREPRALNGRSVRVPDRGLPSQGRSAVTRV